MAPHSSTLAWKIPWTEEPGRLQSMGWLRVRPDSVTSLLLFTFVHWRRKWQPTPVFLPRESWGQGSLVGCRLWGRTDSDTTEVTQQQHTYISFLLSHPPPNTPSLLYRSSQSTELSSLCYTAGSHLLSSLHMVVYICQCYCLNSSPPRLPRGDTEVHWILNSIL